MPPVAVRWADLAVPAWMDRWLTDAERGRMGQLRYDDDRARFLGAHALGRVAVAEHVGCRPDDVALVQRCASCGGPHGRPVAEVGGGATVPHVSLAHAGRVVVAAVASAPVGVDVEPLEQPPGALDAIAEQLLDAEERAAATRLGPADRAVALLRRWLAAEAVAKATGEGIVGRLEGGAAPVGWQVVELPLDGAHLGAVAAPDPGGEPLVVDERRFGWDLA